MMNRQFKHRKLARIESLQGNETPSLSRARKISVEADTMVSFIKTRSTHFEKKFYMKRNSAVVEQRMCYNTRFDVANKRELLKVLRLVAEVDTDTIEKSVNRGCINDASCTEFTKSNLSNAIPIVDNYNCGQTNVFALRNVSYDAFCDKYTHKDLYSNNHFEKVAAIKNLMCYRSNDEKKVGDVYFEFTCAALENVSFYIIMHVYEKSHFSFKSNTKQRVKKMLSQCTQDIRCFNQPTSLSSSWLPAGFSLENNMAELLQLDMSNWKTLDYKFKSSKDEAFYKQIRRKNRSLSQV